MPKKKTGKHLRFHMSCMGKLIMPYGGLCSSAHHDRIEKEYFDLFEPTGEDYNALCEEDHDTSYWGSGSYEFERHIFTPLRQTIVLFMAAISNEL